MQIHTDGSKDAQRDAFGIILNKHSNRSIKKSSTANDKNIRDEADLKVAVMQLHGCRLRLKPKEEKEVTAHAIELA